MAPVVVNFCEDDSTVGIQGGQTGMFRLVLSILITRYLRRHTLTRLQLQGDVVHMPDGPRHKFAQLDVDILLLISQGDTYVAAAKKLRVSAATVAYHVGKLERTLGTKSVPALIAIAIVGGILSADSWPLAATGMLEMRMPPSGENFGDIGRRGL